MPTMNELRNQADEIANRLKGGPDHEASYIAELYLLECQRRDVTNGMLQTLLDVIDELLTLSGVPDSHPNMVRARELIAKSKLTLLEPENKPS